MNKLFILNVFMFLTNAAILSHDGNVVSCVGCVIAGIFAAICYDNPK